MDTPKQNICIKTKHTTGTLIWSFPQNKDAHNGDGTQSALGGVRWYAEAQR